MANITNYLRDTLIQRSLCKDLNTNWPYTSTYVGLFVQSPTPEYTSTGPTGIELYAQNNYQRKLVTWSNQTAPYWELVNGKIYNASDIAWTANGVWSGVSGGASPAAITTVGVFTSLTGGNLLWYGPLSTSVEIGSGDTFTISPHSLIISLT